MTKLAQKLLNEKKLPQSLKKTLPKTTWPQPRAPQATSDLDAARKAIKALLKAKAPVNTRSVMVAAYNMFGRQIPRHAVYVATSNLRKNKELKGYNVTQKRA